MNKQIKAIYMNFLFWPQWYGFNGKYVYYENEGPCTIIPKYRIG